MSIPNKVGIDEKKYQIGWTRHSKNSFLYDIYADVIVRTISYMKQVPML